MGAWYPCRDGTSSVEVRLVVDDEVATPATGDVGLLRVTRTLTYYRTAFHLRDRDRGSTVATVTPPGW
ncbi:hypothetical protein KC207_14900 [Phycicoccus sp. BSK3Z-2]|uniref:Uncharacterized protein n=1 Tax=Phycicoccus avicenniae TaxID=2828860 RepID=A0A941DE03_9MICO|nr:hypothetical protein [Phycicoccus avicenniae]MBR7744582.1 hypothetical protein [Phycicoccus avicenniae]